MQLKKLTKIPLACTVRGVAVVLLWEETRERQTFHLSDLLATYHFTCRLRESKSSRIGESVNIQVCETSKFNSYKFGLWTSFQCFCKRIAYSASILELQRTNTS